MNTWLLFGLLAPTCWGICNVLDSAVRRTYVKNDFAMTWFLGIARIPFVILLLVIHPLNFTHTVANIMLCIAGILWVIPFILYYYSINIEEPTRIALFLQCQPIFTLIVSIILLHENLTGAQSVAFFLMMTGGVLASMRKIEGKWHVSRAIIIIAIATICWAFSDVLFRQYSLEINDFWDSFNWYFLGSFLVSPLMMIFRPRSTQPFTHYFTGITKRGYFLLFTNQAIGMFGSGAFAYALSLGKASLTGVLQAIQPLAAFCVALVLPRFIFEVKREETSAKILYMKALSFLCIVAGLVVLSR